MPFPPNFTLCSTLWNITIFQTFSLLLVLSHFIMMCLGVVFFVCLVFWAYRVSWGCEFTVFIKYRQIWAIISWSNFSVPLQCIPALFSCHPGASLHCFSGLNPCFPGLLNLLQYIFKYSILPLSARDMFQDPPQWMPKTIDSTKPYIMPCFFLNLHTYN